METINFLGTKFEGRKLAFDARLPQLAKQEPDVEKIAMAMYGSNPTQQAVDAIFYAAKSVSEKSSFDDLFKSDDKISVGLTSLSEGKPSAGEYFLTTGIMLQYAVAKGTSENDVAKANYGLIHPFIRNGEIKIVQNNREILPAQSCEIFHVADHYEAIGDTNAVAGNPVENMMMGVGHVGHYKLANPKWIFPDRKIDVSLKFTSQLPVNAAIRIIFIGVKNGKL
jgi:hypothetical protein